MIYQNFPPPNIFRVQYIIYTAAYEIYRSVGPVPVLQGLYAYHGCTIKHVKVLAITQFYHTSYGYKTIFGYYIYMSCMQYFSSAGAY